MKHYFPPIDQNFRYLQTNRSDLYGSLWSTFNIDFQSNVGVMRLSQKLATNTTSSDDADLGLPVAFEYFDDRWFSICGTRVFKNTTESILNTFSEDASTGAQTDYNPMESDLKIFNSRLWSTTTDNLYSKAGGSGTGDWTSRDALSDGIHKMAYFKKYNRLYYVDSTTSISSIDTADVVANSTGDYFINLGLVNSRHITTIEANSEFIWIGTKSTDNSSAGMGVGGSIIQWDGISGQIVREFKIDSAGVLAICIVDDIPYAIDTEGRVLVFTGSAFKEIARLPIDRMLLLRATTSTDGSSGAFIMYNGMVGTKNNTILFLINNLNDDNGSTINENLPSGIWELDLNTKNFTHKYSPSIKPRTSATVTDYGQNRILSAGALKMNYLGSQSNEGRSTLICGFGYYTTATVSKYGIFVDSPVNATTEYEGQKRGYFVTSWFDSSEIIDIWKRLSASFRKFLVSTDRIIFKYRFDEESSVEATITWAGDRVFTTTTNIAAYGPTQTPFDGTTGGEVEVIQGQGSGGCYHIVSISLDTGTYTVTLDSAVLPSGSPSGTAKARFQKWIKISPEITGTDSLPSFKQIAIDKANPRIQIKGILEFTGNGEFRKFILLSENHIDLDE